MSSSWFEGTYFTCQVCWGCQVLILHTFPHVLFVLGDFKRWLNQPLFPLPDWGRCRNTSRIHWNRGSPKSSTLMGFSIINHPFWVTPMTMEPPFGTPRAGVISCRPNPNLCVEWPQIVREGLNGAVKVGSWVHVSPFPMATDQVPSVWSTGPKLTGDPPKNICIYIYIYTLVYIYIHTYTYPYQTCLFAEF